MLRRFLDAQTISGRVSPEEHVRLLTRTRYIWVFDNGGEVVHQTPADESGNLEVEWDALPGEYLICYGRRARRRVSVRAELTVHALSEEVFGWTR